MDIVFEYLSRPNRDFLHCRLLVVDDINWLFFVYYFKNARL